MKKILLYLCLMIFVLGEDGSDDLSSTIDSKQTTQTKGGFWKKSLRPSEVKSHSYGVFKVGYAYQYQKEGFIVNQTTMQTFKYTEGYHNVYFGLERGWVGGIKDMFMAGAYLDGVAGQTFFLSVGAKVALRLLNGWMIPHFGFGYQIQHLSFPSDTHGYVMHGGVATLGLFANVAKGFGIDLSLRAGTPFAIIKASDARKFNKPQINHLGVMVSFTFYDFGI